MIPARPAESGPVQKIIPIHPRRNKVFIRVYLRSSVVIALNHPLKRAEEY